MFYMILSPVRGDFPISQIFGVNQKVYAQFGMDGHDGQDIACPTGTPIYSPIDGIAEFRDSGDNGYGKYVKITENKLGECRQIYLAHFSQLEFESGRKEEIKAGQLVGSSGNTGNSTGSHLHWSYRKIEDGKVLDYGNGYHGRQDIFQKGWIVENNPSKY